MFLVAEMLSMLTIRPLRAATPGYPRAMTPPSADRESAFKHFAPLVAGIPESDLELWHYDAEILRVNTQRSLDALEPFLQATAKKMGHINVAEIRELPRLGLALAFADARVFIAASAQEIKTTQARQRPKRKLAMAQLVILNEMGLIKDPSKVEAILPGRGPLDEARDGVACVAVFRDNAADVKGKHPFDDAWLAGLAADSNWLLEQLKVSGAKIDKQPKSADALVRDQLFTEIVRRYGQGKKVAVERWGWKSVDEHYPSLFARVVAAQAASAAAPVAPAVGAAPVVKPDP